MERKVSGRCDTPTGTSLQYSKTDKTTAGCTVGGRRAVLQQGRPRNNSTNDVSIQSQTEFSDGGARNYPEHEILPPDGIWRVFDVLGQEGQQKTRALPRQCSGATSVANAHVTPGQRSTLT